MQKGGGRSRGKSTQSNHLYNKEFAQWGKIKQFEIQKKNESEKEKKVVVKLGSNQTGALVGREKDSSSLARKKATLSGGWGSWEGRSRVR